MKFSAEKSRRNATINLTPLIDVMFLMLIFVLLAAKFDNENGIAVALPKGANQETASPQIQVLSIDRTGALFFGSDPIAPAELPARIAKMRAEMPDPVLVINADKAAAYGVFAEAIDLVKSSGQTKFYFKTSP